METFLNQLRASRFFGVGALRTARRWNRIAIALLIGLSTLGLSFGAAYHPAKAAPPADCTGVVGIPLAECNVLIALYTQTNGAAWTNNSGWTTLTPCTTPWFGITCSAGRVVNIALNNNNLVGTLPAALNSLTNLQIVDLSFNHLTGSIPALSGLTSLNFLNLGNNQLTGSIPVLTGLTNLSQLWLYTNQLTGSIPVLTGLTNLSTLLLGNNQLTGSIPPLTGLTSLTTLDLNTNQLTGTIPLLTGLSNLSALGLENNQLTGSIPVLTGSPFLYFVTLSNNQLTGTIPSLTGLTTLQDLFLNNNHLTGTIPSLVGFSILSNVYLESNQFTGNAPDVSPSVTFLDVSNNLLNGTIPASLTLTAIPFGNLGLCGTGNILIPINLAVNTFITARLPGWTGGCNLPAPANCALVSEISLTECNFLVALYTQTNGAAWTNNTGWNTTMPCSTPWYGITCTLGSVTDISLGSNNLVGTIPATLNSLTSLQTLSLFSNQLTGTIPALTGLANLIDLNLENNQLTGSIPALTGLTSLAHLQLYQNQLTGSIPALTGLTNLATVDLNTNQLSGTIPSLTGLTYLGNVSLYSNQLTGAIPSLAGLTNLTNFDLSSNQLTGTIPPLTGLTSLSIFVLQANQLTGTIPSLTGLTNLIQFDLTNNQLTGTVPTLTGLTGLQSILLGTNQLTGTIPSLTGLTNLQSLYLNANQLTGTIPSLTSLTSLTGLSLSTNQLTGAIPSITGLTNLQLVYLQNNQFTGNAPDVPPSVTYFDVSNNLLNGTIPVTLTSSAIPIIPQQLFLCGTGNILTPINGAVNAFIAARIPGWAGSCNGTPVDCTLVSEIPLTECNVLMALYTQTNGAAWTNNSGWTTITPCTTPWYGITCNAGNTNVTQINLPANNLVGTLPATFNNLTNLQTVKLFSNQLTGSIPALTGLTNLSQFWLYTNQLTGTIPSLTGLTNLTQFYLNSNQLTGTIPSLSGLTTLTGLALNNNQLTGAIPALTGLTSLQTIALQNNQLSGAIPALTGLTSLVSVRLSSNQLTGNAPDVSPSVIYLDVSSNLLNGTIPASLTLSAIPTTPQQLFLCGTGNVLTPLNGAVNTYIAVRIPGWTGSCTGVVTPTPTPTPSATPIGTPSSSVTPAGSTSSPVLSGSSSQNAPEPVQLNLTTPQIIIIAGDAVPINISFTNLSSTTLYNLVVVIEVPTPLTITSPIPNCRQVVFNVGNVAPNQQVLLNILASVPNIIAAAPLVAAPPDSPFVSFEQPLARIAQSVSKSAALARPRTLVNVVQATWGDQNVATAAQVITLMPKATLPGTGEHPAVSTSSPPPEMTAFAVGIVGLLGFGFLFATRKRRARSN